MDSDVPTNQFRSALNNKACTKYWISTLINGISHQSLYTSTLINENIVLPFLSLSLDTCELKFFGQGFGADP